MGRRRQAINGWMEEISFRSALITSGVVVVTVGTVAGGVVTAIMLTGHSPAATAAARPSSVTVRPSVMSRPPSTSPAALPPTAATPFHSLAPTTVPDAYQLQSPATPQPSPAEPQDPPGAWRHGPWPPDGPSRWHRTWSGWSPFPPPWHRYGRP
jgi:hypothetical protein